MKHTCMALLAALSMMACAGQSSKNGIILPVEEYAEVITTDTTAYILDVRTAKEYAEGHIDGASLLNVLEEESFVAGIDSLPADRTYYIYCRSGRRSRKAAALMTERGLKVVDLEGGYNAWKEK